jgi:uncharacterized protein (TIGR03067 family)
MHSIGIASFAVGLLLVVGTQGDEAALKNEKAALEGAWKVAGAETAEGKDTAGDGATLEFDKDGKTFTFTLNGEAKKGTFKLNAAGKPKEIDFTLANEDRTMEAIYVIEKTTLKICLALGANDGRPTEFATTAGKYFVLAELERVK